VIGKTIIDAITNTIALMGMKSLVKYHCIFLDIKERPMEAPFIS